MPVANRISKAVECSVCYKIVSRKADLPRHMRTHDPNKEALMHSCPFPDCNYKTLQKSNVQTHIRTHTREHSKECPEPGCAFTTSDPGSFTRHRKQVHGYKPKARCSRGQAAHQSSFAPYPSPQPIKAEVERPVSMDLIDLTYPKLTGFTPCDASSFAGSSSSDCSQYSNDLNDFSWEQLFSTIPTATSPSIYSQPSPSQLPVALPTHIQPALVPFDLSNFQMPQFDTELFSNANFNLQYPPVSSQNFSHSQISELDHLMQSNGSGHFEHCGYQHMTTYPTMQPSLMSSYYTY